MLTLEYLKNLKPGTFFKSGYFEHKVGKMRWVAVRGHIWDWAIYYYHKGYPDKFIASDGDKLYDEKLIRKLVSCDDEAFKMYRY